MYLSEQDLAQKIKGYQEQIASLNSKCKMLTVKAKHATTLLTVTDVEGLTGSVEELDGDAAKRRQSQVQTSLGSVCNTVVSMIVNESSASILNNSAFSN